MKTIKKILAVLLVAVFVTAFAPTAFAAVLPSVYPIWVGSTQVTDTNKNDILKDGGSVTFNSETYTLTLTDATINGSGYRNSGITVGGTLEGSSVVEKINIELVGESKVYANAAPSTSAICAGLFCFNCKEVNFTGDGTATFTGIENGNYTAAGIYGSQNTTVNVDGAAVITIVGTNFKYYSFSDNCSVRERNGKITLTQKVTADNIFKRLIEAIGSFFVSIGNFFKNLF